MEKLEHISVVKELRKFEWKAKKYGSILRNRTVFGRKTFDTFIESNLLTSLALVTYAG